jgi:hypothetical protein
MKTLVLCFFLFLGANAIHDRHEPNLIRRSLRQTLPEDVLHHYYRGDNTSARAARIRLLRHHTATSEDSENASSGDIESTWARSRDDAASEDGPEVMSPDVALVA